MSSGIYTYNYIFIIQKQVSCATFIFHVSPLPIGESGINPALYVLLEVCKYLNNLLLIQQSVTGGDTHSYLL